MRCDRDILAPIQKGSGGISSYTSYPPPAAKGRLSMTDHMHCHIRVKGHLTEQWLGWFGDLVIQNLPGDELLMSGVLPDQAAFFGVLAHIRDLGLRVVALNCIEDNADLPVQNEPPQR
jgi:hypothetical protein